MFGFFFGNSSRCSVDDYQPVLYHQSQVPKIIVGEPKDDAPRLLCILNRPEMLNLSEGQIVIYENSSLGALLSHESGIASPVEPVETPNGQRYRVVGVIPPTPPLYLYIEGDLARFYDHKLPTSPASKTTLWWMGKGIYHHYLDGIWRHEICLPVSIIQESSYLLTLRQGLEIADELVNVRMQIQESLSFLGLDERSEYSGITSQQCQSLAQIGDRWNLSWCYSQRQIRRAFRKPLKYYSFTWSYSP